MPAPHEDPREENLNVQGSGNGAADACIGLTVGRMKRFSIDNADIAYSERGEGEPVFLVHAGVFSDWFLPVSETRSLDGFRVVRVRRAGYGDRMPSRHLTIADHARHVAALADHLGLERIHWVGHSSSCQMGLQLALERTNLVASLILLEPAAVGGFFVPASEELATAVHRTGDGRFRSGRHGDGVRYIHARRMWYVVPGCARRSSGIYRPRSGCTRVSILLSRRSPCWPRIAVRGGRGQPRSTAGSRRRRRTECASWSAVPANHRPRAEAPA